MENIDSSDYPFSSETLDTDSILIVEDDEGFNRLIARKLEREGFITESVFKGEDAIALIQKNTYTLMLLDMQLPDMDGIQIVSSLKTHKLDQPFVIMTGYGDEKIAVDFMKSGAIDYLIKTEGLIEILPQKVQWSCEYVKKHKKLDMMERRIRLTQHSIDQSSEIFYWLYPDGRFYDVNTTACTRLGFDRTELLSMSIQDINPTFSDTLWNEIKRKKILTYESIFRSRDLKDFPVEIGCSYYEFEGQEYIFSHARDITERKEIEKQKDMLLSAIEQSNDTVEILDLDGHIIYVNQAFEKTSGYSKSDAYGKLPLELFFKEGINNNDKINLLIWENLKADKAWMGRITNLKKDGSLITEDVSISPVKNSKGKVTAYASVKRDITEALRMEEEKNGIKERLFQSQKMESVGQLASGVAHDFNNILSGIMNASQLLNKPDRHLDEKGRRYVEMILKSSERAAKLISRLLNFSRRNKLSFSKIALSPIIEETVYMLQQTVRKNITICYTQCINNDNKILGDPSSLQNALLNLGINSSHAIESKGRIDFSLKERELDPEYCDKSTFRIKPGNYYMIEIKDTGSGIKPEDMGKIFQAFFTTKEMGQGSGLGLDSVLRTIQEHNGAIEVESEPGKGSTFSLMIPIISLESNHTYSDSV